MRRLSVVLLILQSPILVADPELSFRGATLTEREARLRASGVSAPDRFWRKSAAESRSCDGTNRSGGGGRHPRTDRNPDRPPPPGGVLDALRSAGRDAEDEVRTFVRPSASLTPPPNRRLQPTSRTSSL